LRADAARSHSNRRARRSGTDASAPTSNRFSGNPRSLPRSALHRESFSDAGQPSHPHPFHSDARRIDRRNDRAGTVTLAKIRRFSVVCQSKIIPMSISRPISSRPLSGFVRPCHVGSGLTVTRTVCPDPISIRARFQSGFNSAGRHKRRLRGGSFHKVRQLPRARAQAREPDSMERSRGWTRDRR
jgi:hypothetical protein